jgi:hypothetical protein
MGILGEPAQEDLLKSIFARKEAGELFEQLDRLFRDASQVLTRRPQNAAEMTQLAGSVAEIRHLLVELSSMPLPKGRQGSSREHCRALADRYLDLEGRVKELRNDLTS